MSRLAQWKDLLLLFGCLFALLGIAAKLGWIAAGALLVGSFVVSGLIDVAARWRDDRVVAEIRRNQSKRREQRS